MFTIGQDLYRLTLRDQQTSYVDPFFRQLTVNLGVGVSISPAVFSIPKDRCLFLHSVLLSLGSEAGTTWDSFSASQVQDGLTLMNLVLRRFSAAAGAQVQDTYPVGIIVPPGTSSISVGATRVGTTGAVSFTALVLGYLIPPGRINRA